VIFNETINRQEQGVAVALTLGWVLVIFGLVGYIATYFRESNAVFPWTLLFLASAIVGAVILSINGVDILWE